MKIPKIQRPKIERKPKESVDPRPKKQREQPRQPKKQREQARKQKSGKKQYRAYVTVLKNGVPHNLAFNLTGVTREQAQSIFNSTIYPKLQKRYDSVIIKAITEEEHVRLRKMKLNTLSNFCTHFGVMLTSGMTIEEILDSFAEDLPEFKNLASVLRKHIDSGLTLSQAMDIMGIFPDLLIRKVEAGEKGGNLAEAFSSSAEYYNNLQKTKGAISKALAYPAMISMVTLGVLIFYIVSIVPRMIDTYASLEIELPALTMAFISLFDFIASNILIIAALIAVIYIGARYLITHNEKIGLAWERFVLRIPILNKIKKNQDLYNFAYTFSELYAAGLLPSDALFGAQQVVTLKLLRNYIEDVRAEIEHGVTLSSAFDMYYDKYKIVGDRILISFIKNGENTDLHSLLDKYARKKEADLQLTIDTSLSAIEPLIMVGVMVVIGAIVLILYQPMMSIIPQMANQLY